jgi:hypothetical protein
MVFSFINKIWIAIKIGWKEPSLKHLVWLCGLFFILTFFPAWWGVFDHICPSSLPGYRFIHWLTSGGLWGRIWLGIFTSALVALLVGLRVSWLKRTMAVSFMDRIWIEFKIGCKSESIKFLFGLCILSLIFTVISVVLSVFDHNYLFELTGCRFVRKLTSGELWFCLFLGIFTSSLVVVVVENRLYWLKFRGFVVMLGGRAPNSIKNIIVPQIPLKPPSPTQPGKQYKITGPGESVSLGLILGALNSVLGSPLSADTIKFTDDDIPMLRSGNVQLVLGGPRYNTLTRRELDVHAANGNHSYIEVQYKTKPAFITIKDPSKNNQQDDGKVVYTYDEKKDYGVVWKKGRTIYLFGLGPQGVSLATSCLFDKTTSDRVVQEFGKDKWYKDFDYVLVVSAECSIKEDNPYSINNIDYENLVICH